MIDAVRGGVTRTLIVVLVVSLLLGGAGRADDDDEEDGWTKIAQFSIGAGPREVAYESLRDGDNDHGPQALSLGPDGRLYLLDSVNRRIHIFSDGRTSVTSVPVTGARYPRELLVTADELHVLDTDDRILTLDRNGLLVRTTRLPEGLSSSRITRLWDGPGGPRLAAGAGFEFSLSALPASVDLDQPKSGSGRGITSPDGRKWLTEGGPLEGRLYSADGSTSASLPVQSYFGGARIVGFDDASDPYVVVEDVSEKNGTIKVEQSLRRYDAVSGRLTGATRLRFDQFAINPRRSVDVAPNGTVYTMVPGRNNVRVLPHTTWRGLRVADR